MTRGAIRPKLTHRELSTVLAALRYWQSNGKNFDEIYEIASDGRTIDPLSTAEIDDLCERINCA